jgi:MoaA/NifB/PqqE/SkfB family radical SAM enzyme
MNLKSIGFYTLSDERCLNVSALSPMQRCEMILTDKCNFKCPYCRGLRNDCKGDLPIEDAMATLKLWCDDGLKNVRFSGGEPLTYPHLDALVKYAKFRGVEHIAISSNGSFPFGRYYELITEGVNDFSISLDACCSSYGDKMAGVSGQFERVTYNIVELSKLVYTTVGVVLTAETVSTTRRVVEFAHGLGVTDIRIIPCAQEGNGNAELVRQVGLISQKILDAHPILKYRVQNILNGVLIRGLQASDTHTCYLALDDSVVSGGYHYPCVIYLREKGEPIGKVGPNMRGQRVAWMAQHDTHKDPICSKQCLDVCCAHNNRCAFYQERKHWFVTQTASTDAENVSTRH